MKRILLFFALLAATFTLSSCESSDNHYEPSLYEVVAGRTWVGDLGFYDAYYPNPYYGHISLVMQ